MSNKYEKSANYAQGQAGATIGGELDAYDRLWDSAYAWIECCGQIRAEAAARRIAQTNEECASQVKQDRIPMIDEDLHATAQLPAGARHITRHEILARASKIEKDRRSIHHNKGNSMNISPNNILPTDEEFIRARSCSAEKAPSQIHALLDEGRDLMNELSEEIDRTFRQFEPVLMPVSPGNTGPGEQIVPQPIQSEIGDLLSGRNRSMRSLIGQLRSINNRSTVAP